jgi:hypothetical protein
VSDLAVNHYAPVHIQYPAQRWTAFQDIGPSPCRRKLHAMAHDGKRVFVLGGSSSLDAHMDEFEPIHVLDTGMYYLFIISYRQPSSLKQSSSFTRNPTLTLSSTVRTLNLRRSYPRVRVNHNSLHSLCQMPMQHMVLILFKKLPQENWPVPPPIRLLASKTPV